MILPTSPTIPLLSLPQVYYNRHYEVHSWLSNSSIFGRCLILCHWDVTPLLAARDRSQKDHTKLCVPNPLHSLGALFSPCPTFSSPSTLAPPPPDLATWFTIDLLSILPLEVNEAGSERCCSPMKSLCPLPLLAGLCVSYHQQSRHPSAYLRLLCRYSFNFSPAHLLASLIILCVVFILHGFVLPLLLSFTSLLSFAPSKRDWPHHGSFSWLISSSCLACCALRVSASASHQIR